MKGNYMKQKNETYRKLKTNVKAKSRKKDKLC